MKKFFKQKAFQKLAPEISSLQINKYREDLIVAMKELGASDCELKLICDATIINSIQNNRRVEDVAWAILQ